MAICYRLHCCHYKQKRMAHHQLDIVNKKGSILENIHEIDPLHYLHTLIPTFGCYTCGCILLYV